MTARIVTESITRIDHVDGYVDQFKAAIVDGSLSSAKDALKKMGVIVDQCKMDVLALQREEKKNKGEKR